MYFFLQQDGNLYNKEEKQTQDSELQNVFRLNNSVSQSRNPENSSTEKLFSVTPSSSPEAYLAEHSTSSILHKHSDKGEDPDALRRQILQSRQQMKHRNITNTSRHKFHTYSERLEWMRRHRRRRSGRHLTFDEDSSSFPRAKDISRWLRLKGGCKIFLSIVLHVRLMDD